MRLFMPTESDLIKSNGCEGMRGIIMLKTSTLIAIIGTVVHFLVQLYLAFNPIVYSGGENSNSLFTLMQISFFVFLGCLVQFFVVFFIKLSVTKK